MSAVVHGILGGAIAALLTAYVASRAARSGEPGELRFGMFMWGLGFACLLFAAFPIVITLFFGHEREFAAKVALFCGFLLGAVYCLGEAALVRGRFDESGIDFYSPWTGRKQQLWSDLVSVKLNETAGWYTLTFRDGSRVRLSRFLAGHASVLETALSGGAF